MIWQNLREKMQIIKLSQNEIFIGSSNIEKKMDVQGKLSRSEQMIQEFLKKMECLQYKRDST